MTAYAAGLDLVPPLTLEEIRTHAMAVARAQGAEGCLDFITVLVGNASWLDTVAAVPYERRILLLPQCLRTEADCPAPSDAFGVLCTGCGRCAIADLHREAEDLGYVVLTAEGTTVVSTLLEQGRIDAVIGVSCLTALEKSFPLMTAEAIPGIAIPLLRDGCDSTDVDVDWVRETVRLHSPGTWHGRFDLEALRDAVRSWFDVGRLRPLLQREGTRTEELGLGWLATGGKRWRPFLLASAHHALAGPLDDTPAAIRQLGVAVECFHKASLVHDDIEDNDDRRYDAPTLHCSEGVPVALNAGDFLLGEGYRLIADCALDPALRARMLSVAADGHRSLSLGQGEELCWTRDPGPIGVQDVLTIFRHKTAPAFSVALQLGALSAGADPQAADALRRFSDALGVAYQIRDDLGDGEGLNNDLSARRLSILIGLCWDHGDEAVRADLADAFAEGTDAETAAALLTHAVDATDAVDRAKTLLDHYRNESVRSLHSLRNAHLKGLLRRVVRRILG